MGQGNDGSRYVQQRPDGDWEVVKEDRQRAIIRNDGGGELVIKDRHGKIRDTDTIAPGHESPRRDTR
jgi:hypothetical protein